MKCYGIRSPSPESACCKVYSPHPALSPTSAGLPQPDHSQGTRLCIWGAAQGLFAFPGGAVQDLMPPTAALALADVFHGGSLKGCSVVLKCCLTLVMILLALSVNVNWHNSLLVPV